MTTEHKNIPCYVETVPGIGEVAWIEIRDRLPRSEFGQFLFARDERGIVYFKMSGSLSDLSSLRTVEAAYLVALYMPDISRGYRDLRRMQEQMMSTGEFGRAVNALSRFRRRQVMTYRLQTHKYGQHQYRRDEFRGALIEAIEALYPRWQRVQKDADAAISANVFGSTILIGMHLFSPGERHESRTSGLLSPSLAAAMALLSEPQEGDIFVDPLCGFGSIVGERARLPGRLILGGDVAVSGVRRVAPGATLVQWDGRALPLSAASASAVATRFVPVTADQLDHYFRAWLSEIQRVLRPQARAVILTHEYEFFKDVIRDYAALEIRGGYSVTVAGQWGRIYIVERLAA